MHCRSGTDAMRRSMATSFWCVPRARRPMRCCGCSRSAWLTTTTLRGLLGFCLVQAVEGGGRGAKQDHALTSPEASASLVARRGGT
eukprot:34997-Eustigmatos_ZCMA.PRE.1